MSLTVKITGPGQTFELELYYIQKLLEDMGWGVELRNDNPNHTRYPHDEKKMAALLETRKAREKTPNRYKFNTATIIAENMPWGG